MLIDDDDKFDFLWDTSTCHDVGINGGCGVECPVFLRGDCEYYAEAIPPFKRGDSISTFYDIYEYWLIYLG